MTADIFSHPVQTYCLACARPIRPQRTDPADYALGSVVGRKGRCEKCIREGRGMMPNPEVTSAELDQLLAAMNPLHPDRSKWVKTNIPNPYVCSCGYRVLTYRPKANRPTSDAHQRAVADHKRWCQKCGAVHHPQMARAVGRFDPKATRGYQANYQGAPLRGTRDEATDDMCTRMAGNKSQMGGETR